MEKERLRDRVCGAVKPICTCFSVAARQAREAGDRRPFEEAFPSGGNDPGKHLRLSRRMRVPSCMK